MTEIVKTRFCPSPTGVMTLGNARTALLSALYALHSKGQFLLRMEDTDIQRSTQAFAEGIMADLQWMGLQWQEGVAVGGPQAPYYQSQRQAIYAPFYEQLIAAKVAYPCFCSDETLLLEHKIQRAQGLPPRYPGTCLHLSDEAIAEKKAAGLLPALRFHVPPATSIVFTDHVKGEQRFLSQDIGDFIIRRADGTTNFMFGNAVDDALMGVNYVMRGDDHLANTPRQILILQALNLPIPEYAHLSLITGSDGSPLSKRNGSRSIADLRAEGYFPLAILNYLARLGHYYEKTTLLTLAELGEYFSLRHLNSSSARFDPMQLLHWQKLAVLAATHEQLWQWLTPEQQQRIPADRQTLFLTMVQQNCMFALDAKHWASILFEENPIVMTDENRAILKKAGSVFYASALHAIQQHGINYHLLIEHLKNNLSVKGPDLFQPLRVVLTGLLHGPELATILTLMGKSRVEKIFQQAQIDYS